MMTTLRISIVYFLWAFLVSATKGVDNPCKDGWTPFTDSDGSKTCLQISGYTSKIDNYRDAKSTCNSRGANLVSIFSFEKQDFVKQMMLDVSATWIWTALRQASSSTAPMWELTTGDKPFTFVPRPFKRNNRNGERCFQLNISGRFADYDCSNDLIHYVCEAQFGVDTHVGCPDGYYGTCCDKQCHCHSYVCTSDTNATTTTCPFGCEPGWMGDYCGQKREKASVSYHCIENDIGLRHVSIDIDTKGIFYRNIHAVDDQNTPIEWCSDENIPTGLPTTDNVNIKFYLTSGMETAMRMGSCPGKLLGNDSYEWRIVLQELKDAVMNLEQEVVIKCNFTNVKSLMRTADTEVAGSRTPPAELEIEETKEDVVLEVADAATKSKLVHASVGSPVILKIKFGRNEGSHIKSLSPYNCEAVSGNGTHRIQLLDSNGCQPTNSPVLPFVKTNDTNVIETPWFPYFAIDGSDKVSFQCSFIFCYDDSCNVGCKDREDWLPQSRHVRSIKDGASAHLHDVVETVP